MRELPSTDFVSTLVIRPPLPPPHSHATHISYTTSSKTSCEPGQSTTGRCRQTQVCAMVVVRGRPDTPVPFVRQTVEHAKSTRCQISNDSLPVGEDLVAFMSAVGTPEARHPRGDSTATHERRIEDSSACARGKELRHPRRLTVALGAPHATVKARALHNPFAGVRFGIAFVAC